MHDELIIMIPFQSTPAITGGRDDVTRQFVDAVGLFQSTPAITGGRDEALQKASRP